MVLLGAAALAAPSAAPARAESVTYRAVTAGSRYLPGDKSLGSTPATQLVVTRGSFLEVANVDTISHSITSDAVDADGLPIFDSGLLTTGENALVDKVQALRPGTYTFHCRNHEATMFGTLKVVSVG